MIHVFEELSDEQAGKLIKHIFEYVNDKNPQLDDQILKVCFAPIKAQLKRDLEDWIKICERNKSNGNLGGRPKKNPDEPKKPSGFKSNPENPVKPDNDTDNEIDNEILTAEFLFNEFKKEKGMVLPFFNRMLKVYQVENIVESFKKWYLITQGKIKNLNHAENSFRKYLESEIKEKQNEPEMPRKHPKSTLEDNWW